jgi:DNA-binding transcriptional LysR family regulator
VSELRERPAGTVRITATDYATDTILWPRLTPFLRHYPDIRVEIVIAYGLTDIVAERFDAGVRSGEQVAKDMIAVRIGPDMRIAVVGAPAYFSTRPEPKRPQDLIAHSCINLRLPTLGGLYAWEFAKGGRELKVRVEGQLVFNATLQMLGAALAGFGLAYVGSGAAPSRQGQAQTGDRGLVSALFGLSSLLPEPAAAVGRLRAPRRGAPLPRRARKPVAVTAR